MADQLKQKGERAVNRIVVGILFLIIFGLVGGLAIYILQTPLSGDVQDLLAGLDLLGVNPATGIATIVWFVASTLVIAFISMFIVARLTFFYPFKKAETKKPDIPKDVTIVSSIILGALISLMFFITNAVLKVFGTDLSAGNLQSFANAFLQGNIISIMVGTLFALIVGAIVVGFASRAGTVKKIADEAGIDKF